MANLGSLVVSLEANIARFETDLNRAEAVAKGAFDRIAKAGEVATAATKALGLAIVGLSAGVGISTLVGKFEQVTESLSRLKDMSEKTGASVENLSALAGVAKITGQSIDLVEAGMTRLAKSLSGADDEAKGAGHALAELGLSAAKLRTMDTASSYKEIADKLAEYRDGMGKTALVQDIFGKSGAQQIPILKALAENGDLVAKSTTEQADQAREYIQTLNRLTAAKDALYKVISVQLLPVVSDFVKVLLDAKNETGGVQQAVKNLAADGSIKSWAEGGAMAIAHVLDMFQLIKAVAIEVATPIERIGRNIYTVGALAGIAVSGSLDEKKQAFAALQAENEKYFAGLDARLAKNREPISLYSDRLKEMLGSSAQEAKDRAAREAVKPSLDGYASRLPRAAVAAAGSQASPFDTYVQALDRLIEKMHESEFAALHLRLEQLADAEAIDKTSARYTEAADKIEQYHRAIDKQQLDQYSESVRRMSQEYQFQTSIMTKTVDEQNRLSIAYQNAQQVEEIIFSAQQAHRPLSLAAQEELRKASSEATDSMIRDYEARPQGFERGDRFHDPRLRSAPRCGRRLDQRSRPCLRQLHGEVAQRRQDHRRPVYQRVPEHRGRHGGFPLQPMGEGLQGNAAELRNDRAEDDRDGGRSGPQSPAVGSCRNADERWLALQPDAGVRDGWHGNDRGSGERDARRRPR